MSTRAELRARLKESGYDYLAAARLNEYLDQAADDVQGEELWPWRDISTTVTPGAPVDLGVIDTVYDTVTARPLWPRDRAELVETYGDLTVAGAPRYYWIAVDSTGLTTLTTYPVSTGSLDVRSSKRGGWVNNTGGDADVPAMPGRWHDLIFLLARVKAKSDTGGESDVAALLSVYDRELDKMRDQELAQQNDEADVIRCTEFY